MNDHCGSGCGCRGHGGSRAPALERLCYFFGQFLDAGDFRAEQGYFLSRLELLTRYGIGWGVACGLEVTAAVPESPDCVDRPPERRLELTIEPGIAFDDRGDVLVVRGRCCVTVADRLDEEGRAAFQSGQPVYVIAEHVARPSSPARGAGAAGCDSLGEPQYARIRDEVRIRISSTPPRQPECEPCLGECGDAGVLLAEVTWHADATPPAATVRNEVRRLLGRHDLPAITGLGWVHGGSYTRSGAERVLAAGLGIRFSRPIHRGTVVSGVVDLVVYDGGGGRRDSWYVKQVDIETKPLTGDTDFCREIVVKAAQPEGFQFGDRIRLVLRTSFLLDRCGRAVSGEHIGGGVAYDATLTTVADQHPQPDPLPVKSPPDRLGPWWSGNGVEGGTFESWITVEDGGGS